MDAIMDSPVLVTTLLGVLGLLQAYGILLFAKVVTMRIEEKCLRETNQQERLQELLDRKTLVHILSLGFL
jgi:hypothetical protein